MKFYNPFKKKKKTKIRLGKVGIIVSTEPSLNSGVNDKFNKKIIIYESVEVDGDEILYGKVVEEIPYTKEEKINLTKIKEIPIVEKKYGKEVDFHEGKPFGKVVN